MRRRERGSDGGETKGSKIRKYRGNESGDTLRNGPLQSTPHAQGLWYRISYIIVMLPLEASKEAQKKEGEMGLHEFKVKITKGHYEAPAADDLRTGLSQTFVPFPSSPVCNFTSNVSKQPFLFTSHFQHPLGLARCKENISIGLQWPVSAALIPTLVFEGLHCSRFTGLICQEATASRVPTNPHIQMLGSKFKIRIKLQDITLFCLHI